MINLDKIIEHTKKILATWYPDADIKKEIAYLTEYVPTVEKRGERPILEWLNEFYLKNIALQTSQYKSFKKQCEETYRRDVQAIQQKNGKNKPIEVFSFNACYDSSLASKALSIVEQMEKYTF